MLSTMGNDEQSLDFSSVIYFNIYDFWKKGLGDNFNNYKSL